LYELRTTAVERNHRHTLITAREWADEVLVADALAIISPRTQPTSHLTKMIRKSKDMFPRYTAKRNVTKTALGAVLAGKARRDWVLKTVK
jgi:hypothetical protein